MARRNDIQYVRFYTTGAAAPRVEPKPEQQTITHAPKAPAKRIPIPFDPIAVMGTVVAVAMLLCVLVGLVQLNHVSTQVEEMEGYISAMKAENTMLEAEYRHGYDLEEVRSAALSMGMVPAEQAQRVSVSGLDEAVEESPAADSWWAEFLEDLSALFA